MSVASLSPGVSPPAIRRKDGQRVVTVTADVDASVISGDEANDILANSILADLTALHPDLTYSFGGEQQQQLESLDALYRGFALAMLLIFALLAIPLRSYTKPFIIMAVIPFGFIGVILGHWVLGRSPECRIFHGYLRPEWGGRERFPSHDRFHRSENRGKAPWQGRRSWRVPRGAFVRSCSLP